VPCTRRGHTSVDRGWGGAPTAPARSLTAHATEALRPGVDAGDRRRAARRRLARRALLGGASITS
jgi:hypothetical protein